jgi:DNA-binding NarL/FixJ family response regulator
MATHGRIILVNNSRLVRDMLKKVIGKAPGLEIVNEVEELTEFPEVVKTIKADWAIVLLSPGQEVPEIVENVIKEQSSMRFLLMGVDGSHARMKWSEPHEIPLDEKNLSELLDLMRQELPQTNIDERIRA